MANCAELELGLSGAGEHQYSLRYRFTRPGDLAESNLGLRERALFALDLAALRSLADPEAYGQYLAEAVFHDPAARSGFIQARAVAEALKVQLRLRLDIDPLAEELHSLRWETLHDPDRGTRLCADENVLFSRFLSSASQHSFSPPGIERLRAVALISSPSNLDASKFAPIDVAQETDRARKAMADMDLVPLFSGGAATFSRLLEAMRAGRGADVLYFVAHGWQTGKQAFVLLEKSNGEGERVLVKELINGLSGLRKLPLMAVLISCQSAGSGEAVNDNVLLALGPRLADLGIPAVVAMHGSVSFATMQVFLPEFFRELQRDGQIDRALAVARAAVRNQPDWWMPVLFSRLRDNQLYHPTRLERKPFEPETVYIPAGPFCMGRDPGPGVKASETPLHEVNLPDFRIGKFPVTNRQYLEFVRHTGQTVNPEAGWDGQAPPPDRLDCPITGVTWYQALAYCEWLSQQTGRRYILPNEAQWEKAARGPAGTLFPWGNEWQDGRGNSDPAQITPVGQFPAQNEYNVYDMVGNAREWTLSLWGERRSEPDPAFAYPWQDDGRNDPTASSLVRRVFRGGAEAVCEEMTCTARGGFIPDKSGPPGKRHGFRVILLSDSGK